MTPLRAGVSLAGADGVLRLASLAAALEAVSHRVVAGGSLRAACEKAPGVDHATPATIRINRPVLAARSAACRAPALQRMLGDHRAISGSHGEAWCTGRCPGEMFPKERQDLIPAFGVRCDIGMPTTT